jgi:hypothetical protein
MNARLEAFKTSLASKTDEELFLAYRSSRTRRKSPKPETATVNRKTYFIKGCKPKQKSSSARRSMRFSAARLRA